MSHTPGPWTHEVHDEDGFFRFFDIVTESRSTLGTIDKEDDARLIAAAPDMLSALRECVAWFEDNGVDCVALDEAREALKKAEGDE